MGTLSAGRIKRSRERKEMSQTQLAEKLRVSQTLVSNWEAGMAKPNEAHAKKLKRILGSRKPKTGKALKPKGDEEFQADAPSQISEWLRAARIQARLTVSALARKSGVSQVQIYNLESGRSENPRDETRERLERALGSKVPNQHINKVKREQEIEGLGSLKDFDPYDVKDRPSNPGVYVLYDISERPVYVGKSDNISTRIADHHDKFWFKQPIVHRAAYIEVKEGGLRHQLEQVLIKFLKSNAVINKQSVDR